MRIPSQKILKKINVDEVDMAIYYYRLLLVVSGTHLSEKELQLLAYVATKGSVHNITAKRDFMTRFKTKESTINNMISKLKEMGFFVKQHGKTEIIPELKRVLKDGFHLNILFKNDREV